MKRRVFALLLTLLLCVPTLGYTVLPGDNLWNIARQQLGQGSRYTEIAELNGIQDPDRIFPGQQLILPTEHTAAVAEVNKYGNVVLDILAADLLAMGYEYGDVITVTVNGTAYHMPVCSNYTDVDASQTLCRAAEGKAVTLAVNAGDFSALCGAKAGDRVSFALKEKDGYLSEYIVRQLVRTNEREDYAHLTDEQFANFRAVTTTGMGEGALYRSSSPVNPELGRNTYADAAARAAEIHTVINLADSEEELTTYEGFADSYYSGCNVITLCLGMDFTQPAFCQSLAEGLRFLASHEGPYLIHCTEGKDRAGFVSALLQCFMGASAQEVAEDYMVTYFNYYGVEPGAEPYEVIRAGNLEKSLAAALGVADFYDADLAKEAEEYLREELGLTDQEIAALRAALS